MERDVRFQTSKSSAGMSFEGYNVIRRKWCYPR